MRKRKQPSKTKTSLNSLEEYLRTYDPVTLNKVLEFFESSVGWGMFIAYAKIVQRQYEVEALDAMGKEGTVKSAAFASGYAKGVEDMYTSFVPGLRNTVNNVSLVVENPPPEEVEVG